MNKVWKNTGLYILFILVAVSVISSFYTRAPKEDSKTYSEFINLVKNKTINDVTIREHDSLLIGVTAKGEKIKVVYPSNDKDLISILRDNNVKIDVDDQKQSSWWVSVFSSIFLPLIIFVALWIFMLRQAQGGNSQAMSFGKSKAKLMVENKPKVTFDDVAGVEEAKQELQEVVEFLKTPEKFQALGAKIPKGVLLVGSPGTGKTLLAKAVAGEAGVPFFSISGSDFVEMFVGVGASRVRDLFEQAKKHSPCIVFIDEIDAVGRQRGSGMGGGHDEREQTLNQLLVEMDGFEDNHSTIIIAATNRPDILDTALLRPGRFDRQVMVDKPDLRGREEILKVHVKGKPLAKSVEIKTLAKRTPGFTGADLANLTNEAALIAARYNQKEITMANIEEAIDKVIAGPEKKNRIITDEEKRVIAVHEMGHTMVGKLLPKCDPLHKVTIVSRGMALGLTMTLPEDHVLVSRQEIMDRMSMMLGGRVAEEIIFGEMTTGAQNDLQRATELARKIVMEYGMTEKFGPMTFGKNEGMYYGGGDKDYSESVSGEIDIEVRKLITENYERAKSLLNKHKRKLIKISNILIEKETLDSQEIDTLMNEPEDAGQEIDFAKYTTGGAKVEAPTNVINFEK
ncbi:MAG: ATP-dependent metallopeptidase FtsH/Yme1/Tma family protein [Candidatus Sericytochromatia bacterium]|nr:ATP-dependent metallopeptidase FtsH/Yme1/Tma family protein [Candidatus Sericytochromatia bacterium]